jgi:hypothetical protein
MEPAPQGGVVVLSIPAGAGRRGRGEPYDWDAIVEWHRQRPMTIAVYEHVAYGRLGELRKTYPDCRFVSFNVHQQLPARPAQKPKDLCTVYVQWTGAGEDADSITTTGT